MLLTGDPSSMDATLLSYRGAASWRSGHGRDAIASPSCLGSDRPLKLGILCRWNIVYAIVILQGLASAVPWNVFVTESEYLALRVHKPPFQDLVADNFENVNNFVSQAG